MKNPIDKTLHKIVLFLQLNPENIKRGNELGKEISEIAGELEELVLEENSIEKYTEIIRKVKTHSSKLSRDLLNSKKSSLRSDWKQFAKQDLSKLKDEILALQEFLTAHERSLRKRSNERMYGMDLRNLAQRLTKEGSVGVEIRSQFSELIDSMEDEDIQAKVEEFEDLLTRISKWLLALDTVKMEVKDVEG